MRSKRRYNKKQRRIGTKKYIKNKRTRRLKGGDKLSENLINNFIIIHKE